MAIKMKCSFILIIAMVFSIFVCVNVKAETLNINISVENGLIAPTLENIYYLNSEVYINPDIKQMNMEELLGNEEGTPIIEDISSLDIYECELGEEVYVSYYDGEKFDEYKRLEDGKLKLTPGESDEYNRNVIILKAIQSYKIYRNIENTKEIESVVEKQYESAVYQFIFDKVAPKILLDKNENLKSGDAINISVSDKTGIGRIIIGDGNDIVDDISLVGEERITEYEYELIIGGNGEEIKITAWDLAGNETTYTAAYMNDDIAPTISIDGVRDGEIYADRATFGLNVDENSSSSYLYFKCVYTDAAGNESTIENCTYNLAGKDKISRAYEDEGIYDIVAFAYDADGNYSETKRLSFGIDKNVPIVSLDNVVNGSVYKADVSVYATLRELFFNRASALVQCTLTDNNGTRNVELSPYEIGAKVSKNIYTFSQDGEYVVKMTGRDSFGRESTSECTFTIDKTAPVIDVLDDGSTYIYNGPLEIGIDVWDNISEFVINTELIRKTPSGGYEEEDNSRIISIGKEVNYKVPILKEGEYVLKIVVIDNAGNVSERKVEFIVDENPPVIGYVNEFNERYLNSFNLPDPFTEYISDMTSVRYKAYLNSKEISGCDIKSDGRYMLQIVAVDGAGNKSEESVAFIIDNTAPKVIVKGVGENGSVHMNDIVSLSLFDDMDYFKRVSVNGKNMRLNDNRLVDIPVTEGGEYEINVVASDYAGNETTETVKMKCAYSGNPFMREIGTSDIKTLTKNEEEIRGKFFDRFLTLKYMIFFGIVVVILAILAIVTFVDIKKRKCDTIEG